MAANLVGSSAGSVSDLEGLGATVSFFQQCEPRHRARHIRDPLTAVIHYLLDAGWDIPEPSLRCRAADAEGHQDGWNFAGSDFQAQDQAVELFDAFT
eukprot:3099793-Pyramimonas_sp.AAC.2